MINANELRIGNYVDFYGNHIRVWSILSPTPQREKRYDGKCILEIGSPDSFNVPIDEVNPVALTEELLLRCGFEVKIEHDVCKRYYIGENPITKDWYVSLVWIIEPKSAGMPDYPFYSNGGHVIKYLHQLQNLYFALTGEELTLKDNNDKRRTTPPPTAPNS